MKQQSLKKYPISIQTLEKVIERNYLYIDKMDYIYWMVHDASNYYHRFCIRFSGGTVYDIKYKPLIKINS